MTKAVVRVTENNLIVLCPIGHVLFAHNLDKSFAESSLESTWSAHQRPHDPASHPWDRAASRCEGAGHPVRGFDPDLAIDHPPYRGQWIDG